MFSDALQRAMDWIMSKQSSLGGWSGPWTDRDWSGAWTTAGVGDTVGCNPNEDTVVDAGDLSCTVITIFEGTGMCGRGNDSN